MKQRLHRDDSPDRASAPLPPLPSGQKLQKAKRLDAVLDKLHLVRGHDELRPPDQSRPSRRDRHSTDDDQDQLQLLQTHLPRLSVNTDLKSYSSSSSSSLASSLVSTRNRVFPAATRSSSLDTDAVLEEERARILNIASAVGPNRVKLKTGSVCSSDVSSLSSRDTQDSPLDLSVRSSSSPRRISSSSTADESLSSGSVRSTKRKSLHLGSVMNRLGMPGRAASEIRAYVCPVCGQMFALQDRLAKHVATRHKESLASPKSTATTKSPSKSSSPTVLDAESAGGKAYVCDVCHRSFARSDMLTRHMRLHTGHKPYTCNICHQVFSRSDHLSTHQRTHTGEKPYRCPICPYAACRRDMITRHMRTHTRYEASSTSSAAAEEETQDPESLME